MNIVIDCRNLSHHPNGIDTYTRGLMRMYHSLYPDSRIICIVRREFADVPNNFIFDFNPLSPISALLLDLILFKLNCDIYHAAQPSFLFSSFSSCKKYVTVHDLMFLSIPKFLRGSFLSRPFKKVYLWFMYFISLRLYSQVVSVSQQSKRDIFRFYGLNSFVVPNWFDPQPQEHLTIDSYYKQLVSVPYLLYVGSVRPHKNVSLLINAFLNSSFEGNLVLVTPSRLQTSRNVVYLHEVSPTTLQYLYKNAFAYVQPSLYEGFGLPVLEASPYCSRIALSQAGALSDFSHPNLVWFDPHDINEVTSAINRLRFTAPSDFSSISDEYSYATSLKLLSALHN